MTLLQGWESFYVIVGSSAGALIGLQFVVGAAALLLLFIGIHNAWDTVIWHVFVRKRQQPGEGEIHAKAQTGKEQP
jgi:uncharacterized membrane protein HdeD (DUF308 family)